MFGKKKTDIDQAQPGNLLQEVPTENGFAPHFHDTGQQAFGSAQFSSPAAIQQEQVFGIQANRNIGEVLQYTDPKIETESYKRAHALVLDSLLTKINFNAINPLPREQQEEKINQATIKIINDLLLPLSASQVELMRGQIITELLGFGPLDILLSDPEIADIMVNTANNVFVE